MHRISALEHAPDLSDIQGLVVDWDDLYAFSRGPVGKPGPKIAHHKAVAAGVYGFELTDEVIEQHWGSGLRSELPHFYGHPAGATFEDMLAAFEAADPKYPKPLLSGAKELHEASGRAGLLRGVVTSHLTKNATREITVAGLNPADFAFIHGSDITPAIKPNHRAFDPAIEVLKAHGINPEQSLYLGDSLGDGSAVEAGMQFIGVATGRVAIKGFNNAGYHAEPDLYAVRSLLLPNFVVAEAS